MISRTGSHAIRALVALGQAEREEFVGAGTVARQIGAPENYLGKLLQNLARAGLVESRKGLGGGFRLARDPGSITLLDVIDPIEDVTRFERCILGLPQCGGENPCAVHDRWGALRDSYLALLSETSLADILEFQSKNPKSASSPAGEAEGDD